MMRELRVTADDIGITKENTDTILETVDAGVVRYVSLLPNGGALDYAVEACAMRTGKVRVALHANLTVGPCISEKEQVSLLVDKFGMFCHSPFSLWRMYLMASTLVKAKLARQVGIELRAQFDLVQKKLMAHGLALEGANGHQHVHMIPFVFDELILIPGLTAVRITREPFYVVPGSLGVLTSVRMLGLVVFRMLSGRNESRAHKKGLATNSHFLGLLFSGKMTYRAVDAGLRSVPDEGSTEILFHPGSTALANVAGWCNSSLESKWQCSPWRGKERNLLVSVPLRSLLDSFVTPIATAKPAQKNRTWRDFWDQKNHIYNSMAHRRAHYRALAEGVITLTQGKRPFRLLDYGAGYGSGALAIANAGIEVLLYDPVPFMHQQQEQLEKHPLVHVLTDGDYAALFPESLDGILLYSVLQYLRKDEAIQLLISLRTLLKPGAQLYLGDIVEPKTSMHADVLSLLLTSLKYGFFFPALYSLLATFFSEYRFVRDQQGFSTYTEGELVTLLKNIGYVTHRVPNIGLEEKRIMLVATVV